MTASGRKLEFDLGVPLGAGCILPVTLGVEQQDRLASLHQVFFLIFLGQFDVMHLLGGLASVEVEVDEGGEQGGGDQKQQRLQQTILHFLPVKSEFG